MIRVDAIKNRDSFAVLTASIVDKLLEVLRREHPELSGNFPFKSGWIMQCHHTDDRMIIFLEDAPGIESPLIHEMDDDKASYLKKVVNASNLLSADFNTPHEQLGHEWYHIDRFLYIGPGNLLNFNDRWDHIKPQLWGWVDTVLIPSLHALERSKIAQFLPEHSGLPIEIITDSLWVLECEETSKQGTAFSLKDVGVVTCDHVLGKHTKAFKPGNFTKKYDIEIVARHEVIDVAILKIAGEGHPEDHLEKGDSTNLKQLDPVTIAGFPNYRFGDSGTVITGKISGFRMVSGIRRMLVSMPLIAGNSGSPIFNDQGTVIGVAVTGADKMENAHETEHHGVIPIEAIALIKSLPS